MESTIRDLQEDEWSDQLDSKANGAIMVSFFVEVYDRYPYRLRGGGGRPCVHAKDKANVCARNPEFCCASTLSCSLLAVPYWGPRPALSCLAAGRALHAVMCCPSH